MEPESRSRMCRNESTGAGKKQGQGVRRQRAAEEKEMVSLLKRRDPDGIRLVMEKYHEKLLAVANRICNNPADSEEILQDVYMIALNKIDRFEERSRLSTWLYRITVNEALMKLRGQRANKSTVSMDTLAPFLGEEENSLRSDLEVRPPDESLMSREFYDHVSDSVEGLPDIYKDVFFLRDVQGFSIKETSKMLKTTPAAIKSRLHRSRFFLRESLKDYYSLN